MGHSFNIRSYILSLIGLLLLLYACGTKKAVAAKEPEPLAQLSSKAPTGDTIIKNHSSEPTLSDRPISELRKKMMTEYYQSEQFQVDSLKYANDVLTYKRLQGFSDEEIIKIIKERIAKMKSKYKRF